MKIPVANICVGPVSKEDVMRAMAPLILQEKAAKEEFAVILAFDVKIMADAQEFADTNGIKVMTANIIYHLFDQFTEHVNMVKEKRKKEHLKLAIWPCVLRPVAFFNKKDPIIMGVDVIEGVLKIGTPLCVPEKDRLRIGVVESIERDHKPLQAARILDGSVAIRVRGDDSILAGRHFELSNKLYSFLTFDSCQVLNQYFADELTAEDAALLKKLKKLYGIF
eukprot:TRINITY_DN922_c0_g1_i4.p1 TRINITY_DN922_c0_g1~~TRINITY_DN922_c0_g1_i4.p1  ORF type:complete len:222 (-),score=72.06 TRINITY_DN922_c0_g1_i4:52-717(-)